MQKRGLISALVGIFLINFAEAYSFGYSSLGNLLYWIRPSTIILLALFIIFFALIYFVLIRVLRDEYHRPNKAISGVIAFCMAVLIIYGINRSAWDIENFFYRFNISNILIYIISITAVILIVISLSKKKKSKDWQDEYFKELTKQLKKRK